MDPLAFTPACDHEKGTVFALLSESWAPLWNPELAAKLREFDREVYDHPATVGACTLVTCLNDDPIGMVSYDPRQGPERGIIGYNCIVPARQNRGYGKQQIAKVLRILRARGFQSATVTTGQDEFFLPAQRMYEACGFVEMGRQAQNIDYRVELGAPSVQPAP